MKTEDVKKEVREFFEKFPFFSEIKDITKAYIFFGSNKFLVLKPSWRDTYKQVLRKLIACILLTTFIYILSKVLCSTPASGEVNDIILSIFPDLLGFAIGIYALVHVLPLSKYEKIKMDHDQGKSNVLPTSLNSDLAYPVVAMLSVLFLSVIFEFMPHNDLTVYLNLFLLIYGMAMIYELVHTIFIFTQHHLTTLTKRSPDEQEKNDNPTKRVD